MKHYLELVSLSARVHKKQNRMSVFCIALSVFLVTAIFGMADMFVRSQIMQQQKELGNWHISLKWLSREDAAVIAARPDVDVISPYGVLSFRGEDGFTLAGKPTVICGSDEAYITDISMGNLTEGSFPRERGEALIVELAREALGLSLGDPFTITGPDGSESTFTVSGFLKDAPHTMSNDYYAVFLSTEDYCALYPGVTDGEPADYGIAYILRFKSTANIRRDIAALKSQCGLSDEQVGENTKLLGLLGQSANSFMMTTYTAAGVLSALVLIAGVMMIAGSLNSNVAQRMEFFGLMRCVSATPRQVMRLVRREALHWCRFAVPAGVGAGVVVIWMLCAVLRILSPQYFGAMPLFSVSLPSIAAGAVIGLLTVLLSARVPAKRAAGISPLAAVSGNAGGLQPVRRAANTRLFKVESALGMHHARQSRRNFILMVGSFGISIVLFLSFSVTIDFMGRSLRPLQPWSADLSIISPDNSCSVDRAYVDELEADPAVKAVYGRMFAYDVPITVNGRQQATDLISYEQRQFDWAEDYLIEGSLDAVQAEAGTALIVYEESNIARLGDNVSLSIGGKTAELTIAGTLSNSPFVNAPDVAMIICSEETFRALTGLENYTIIDIQLTRRATDEQVSAIRSRYGDGFTFVDDRLDKLSVLNTYYCVWLFVYGFLALIALITIFNIVNSIAMSVSARTRQYGAFRAIGMSGRQLAKMIVSEAATYAFFGSITGAALGLLCNKLLFEMLIGQNWGDPWALPLPNLTVILLIVLFSVVIAVRGPIKRIQNMSVVDTISAQ